MGLWKRFSKRKFTAPARKVPTGCRPECSEAAFNNDPDVLYAGDMESLSVSNATSCYSLKYGTVPCHTPR